MLECIIVGAASNIAGEIFRFMRKVMCGEEIFFEARFSGRCAGHEHGRGIPKGVARSR